MFYVSLAIYCSRFSQDPLFQGPYSDVVVGTTSEDFKKLGENLGRLYFAGEATIDEWYGFMQGAYLTGQEKGKLIAERILPSKKIKKKSEGTLGVRSTAGVLLFCLFCSRQWM